MRMSPRRCVFWNEVCYMFWIDNWRKSFGCDSCCFVFCLQWIPELKHYAPGVPIVLVGTKLGKLLFWYIFLLISFVSYSRQNALLFFGFPHCFRFSRELWNFSTIHLLLLFWFVHVDDIFKLLLHQICVYNTFVGSVLICSRPRYIHVVAFSSFDLVETRPDFWYHKSCNNLGLQACLWCFFFLFY